METDMQKVLRWIKDLNSSCKTPAAKWSALSQRVVEAVHDIPESEPPTQSQAHKGRWQTLSGLTQRAVDGAYVCPKCGQSLTGLQCPICRRWATPRR